MRHVSKLNRIAVMALAVVGTNLLLGCSGGTQQNDPEYMKNGEAIGKARREMFTKSGGDYAKLTAADKSEFLKGFGGDEAAAKKFWEMMAHPPTSSAPIGR